MRKNDFEKLQKEILAKKVNYEKLGNMETLKGTDNLFWYAFSKKLSVTIKSVKSTDIIINIWNGKKKITEGMKKVDLKELEKLMRKVKIKSCLKWYQKLGIELVSTLTAIKDALYDMEGTKKKVADLLKKKNEIRSLKKGF